MCGIFFNANPLFLEFIFSPSLVQVFCMLCICIYPVLSMEMVLREHLNFILKLVQIFN